MASNMASENEKTHILVTKNDTEACNTSNQGFSWVMSSKMYEINL